MSRSRVSFTDLDQAIASLKSEATAHFLRTWGSNSDFIFESHVSAQVDTEWSHAARDHFDQHKPKAYQRTGAIQDHNVIHEVNQVKLTLEPGPVAVQRCEIILSDEEVAELHRDEQGETYLEAIDPDKSLRYQIKSPVPGYPLIYPYTIDGSQHSLGVIGSWHRQDTAYLMAYLFAGPNEPDQPEIYRKLGGSGKRDKKRGIDLINKFLKRMGLDQISIMPSDFTDTIETHVVSGNTNIDTPFTDYVDDMRNMLERNTKFVASFTHDDDYF